MKRMTRLALLLLLALALQQLSAELPWLQEADGPVAVMAAPSPSPGLCGSKPCDGRPANKNEDRYVYRAMSKEDKARFDKKEPIVASAVSEAREARNACADCPKGGPPECMACHVGNFHPAPSNWISTTAEPNTAKYFNEGKGNGILKIDRKKLGKGAQVADLSYPDGRREHLGNEYPYDDLTPHERVFNRALRSAREHEVVLIKGSIPHKACKLLPGTTVNRFRPHAGRVYRRGSSRKDGC
ncbi:hypothetical protein DFJ73DRAFT_768130 [Zopfochytrium polystomum]|nr:hypothetical protein DFJ73DRAFT_768130 [Zopfochytrium polystomum]